MKLSFLWNFIAILISKIGLFLLTLVCLKLDKNSFAIFGTILLIYNTFIGVFGQAILLTVNKYTSLETDLSKFKKNIVIVFFLINIIILFILIFHYKLSLIISIFLSLSIYLYLLLSFNIGLLYGKEKKKEQSLIYFINTFFLLVGSLISVNYNSLEGITFSLFISSLITYFLSEYIVKKHSITYINNVKTINIYKEVTIPIILSGITFSVVFLLIIEILKTGDNFVNEMYEFTISNQVRMLIATIPLFFTNVLINLLSKKTENVDKINYYTTIIPSMFIVLFIDIVWQYTNAFNSPAFQTLYNIVFFFLVGTLMTSFKSALGRNIIAKGFGSISIYSNLSWSLLFLIMSYVSYSLNYGLEGIAFSFAISQILHYILWRSYFIKRDILQISENDIVILIYFILIIAMLLNILFLKLTYLSLILLLIFSFITYNNFLKKELKNVFKKKSM
jgi:hypothetical protein